jgi:glycosyltransferase involved in cell wall biosynthesis
MVENGRVLFVVTKVDPPETGGELYNLEIYNYLRANGYRITLHTEDDISPVIRRAPGAWFAYLKLFVGLQEPTLIFTSHGLQTRLFIPLLFVKIFSRHRIMSIAHLLFPYKRSPLLRFIDRCIDRIYFRLADAVIANSFFTRAQLIGMGIKNEKIRVVYPGVGLKVTAGEKTRDGGVVKLLAVGFLEERKGYHFLLEALAGIETDYVLRIAGSPDIWPDYSKKLIRMREALRLSNKVDFLGHVNHEKLMSFFKESDIFILASEFEGFGIAFFEAAANRLAIVATTGGAIPEFFTDRETALLVPPGDEGAFRNAIQRLIDEPELRRRLGDNASRMPILKRTWEDAAREVESIVARFIVQSG